MNEELRIFDLIERYYQGVLSEEEKRAVELRAQSDSAFAEYLALHGYSKALVEAAGFDMLRQQMTRDLAGIELKRTRWKWAASIAAALLVLSALVYVMKIWKTRKKEISLVLEQKEIFAGKEKTENTTIVLSVYPDRVNNVHRVKSLEQKKEDLVIDSGFVFSGAPVFVQPVDSSGQMETRASQEPKNIPTENIETKVSLKCNLSFHPIVSPACKGKEDGVIRIESGSVSGGKKPYRFSVQTSGSLEEGILEGLSKGNYNVIMVDADGCRTIREVTVYERSCTLRKSYSFNPDYGEKWSHVFTGNEHSSGNFTIYNRGGIVIVKGSFAENNPAEWYGINTQGMVMEAGLYVCVLEYSGGETETIEISIIR